MEEIVVIILFAIFISLAPVVFAIIVFFMLFKKAGEEGWKAIIPVYNTYIWFKIVNWMTGFTLWLIFSFGGSLIFSILGAIGAFFWPIGILAIIFAIVATISTIVIMIILCYKTGKAFGETDGFCIGCVFLPVIFIPILAFGKAKYIGNGNSANGGSSFMRDCPHCGSKIPNSVTVCKYCYGKVEKEEMPEKTEPESKKRFKDCPYCGEKNNINATKCKACANDFDE